MEAGPYGIFQTVADLIKLLQKEHIRPFASLPLLFMMAPVVIFIAVFAGFAVLPLGPQLTGASLDSGLFFLLAILSLEITGILMAGYASGNKYSTLGAIRAVAQLLTYEIPLGLIVLMVVIWTGTLDLGQIGAAQQPGILNWFIVKMPLFIPAWIIFFICALAESNRAPFDLPEAESELVAGFHTEYSGFPWAVIMLAEYAMMLLTALLGSILFFGAWHTPFINVGAFALADRTTGPVWAIFWLVGKALIFVLIQIWVRWTFPRVRINQMLAMGWKYLTPFGLVLVLLTGLIKIYVIR
jgi:NADH-quinone oxidoreductase subunit H